MSRIHLDTELSAEYQQLFQSCQILPVHSREIDALIAEIEMDQARYQALAETVSIPWQIISLLHYALTERSFESHLHNGDPLSGRTIHQPADRPSIPEPPYSWEQSAQDYLQLIGLAQCEGWSLAGTLYKFEGLGGWAYRLRQPKVHSPYLWCGSQYYDRGKFIAADLWSDEASYTQYGLAVLLRRMAELDLVHFKQPEIAPFVRYSDVAKSTLQGCALQEFLNQLEGIYVRVDGWAGPKTSHAMYRLTGQYLLGDPRAEHQP